MADSNISLIYVKHFFKVLVLLIVALFVLVSGVDVALDRMPPPAAKGAYTYYNAQGEMVYSYTGDLKYCPVYSRVSHYLLLKRT